MHALSHHRLFPLLALLALLALTATTLACESVDDDPSLDTADGGADTATDSSADTSADVPHVSTPGQCFEVFGPPGISHDAPREHDAGIAELGHSRTLTIGFYDFCSAAPTVLDTSVVEVSDGLQVHLDDVPAPGSRVSGATWAEVTLTLTPTAVGLHVVTVRFEVDEGYYEFSIALEGVEADQGPAPLSSDCLVLPDGPLAAFEASAGLSTSRGVELAVDPACDLAFGDSHLVVTPSIEGGDGAFTLDDPAALGLTRGELPTGPRLLSVTFEAPPSGAPDEVAAELVLTTNEPTGEHRIALTGRAE